MLPRALPLAVAAVIALGCGRSHADAAVAALAPPAGAASGSEVGPDADVVLSAMLERAGRIVVEPARVGLVRDEVQAPCEVVAAPDGIAAVGTSVTARLHAWHVAPGDLVRRGQALVTLDSAEVAGLRNQIEREAIRARSLAEHLDEEQRLLAEGATSAFAVRTARTELALARAAIDAARRSLLVAGASETGTAGRFVLRAALDGTVIRREGVAGAVFDPAAPGATLAVVADLTTARIAAYLPEGAGDVAIGAPAVVTLRGRAGSVACRVVWRDPALSRETRARTVHLLPDAPADLSLAENGTARVGRAGAARGVLVPEAAVYREGERTFVFLRRGEGRYAARAVIVGAGTGLVEVVSGLAAGEPVVVAGTFLVASEYARRREERGA